MRESIQVKIGLWTLWSIGVGSVIGGDFFGWQFMLKGGFFSAFIGVTLSALFFWVYAKAITELAARYKTSGGAFDFTKNVLGDRTASVMAVLLILKLILANASFNLSITSCKY